MNIGEEEEAVEYPMPVDPAQVPKREAAPTPAPIAEPVPAGKLSMSERTEYARCPRS